MQDIESVLIKVDKDTKRKMKDMKVNWSEEIRKFIIERISRKENLARAVALTDRISNSQKKANTDTTAIIRKFRDERQGANSS